MIDELVSTAMDLVQKRGYNAFSYRDLSERVGIKTSSIHYHFPTKGDLGEAMMKSYREAFGRALSEIDRTTTHAEKKITRYAELFQKTMNTGGKVCLGCMLATEFLSLPEPVRSQVKAFFVDNEVWLTKVIRAGKESGAFHTKAPPGSLATTIVSALEGGMMAARAFQDPSRLSAVATSIIQLLKGTK